MPSITSFGGFLRSRSQANIETSYPCSTSARASAWTLGSGSKQLLNSINTWFLCLSGILAPTAEALCRLQFVDVSEYWRIPARFGIDIGERISGTIRA